MYINNHFSILFMKPCVNIGSYVILKQWKNILSSNVIYKKNCIFLIEIMLQSFMINNTEEIQQTTIK